MAGSPNNQHMKPLTLSIKDIEILNNIYSKLACNQSLTLQERNELKTFLWGMPSTKLLLNEKVPLGEDFQLNVLDIKHTEPILEKWFSLFNGLSKLSEKFKVEAVWKYSNEDDTFWEKGILIEVKFMPASTFTQNEQDNRIRLVLNADSTAFFEVLFVEQAKEFPELYNFKGSWENAYLLTLKALSKGWPRIGFPEKFEQFLKY